MAHELYDNDTMFSVREQPWHGLGTVLDDYPTVEQAKIASGLTWNAKSVKIAAVDEWGNMLGQVPNQNAIIRDDINHVLGIVGNNYEIFQNSDMWKFVEWVQEKVSCTLETAGSLRNGQTTWVLASNGFWEVVNGDPIQEYFLFRNGFDGKTPIIITFTNIRVVCNNTLTAAIRNAASMYKVKHTGMTEQNLRQVEAALGVRAKFSAEMREQMAALVQIKMDASATKAFIEEVIFPSKAQVIVEASEDGAPVTIEDARDKAVTQRQNRIDCLLALLENGAGSALPGVRGTAYGLYQGFAEWVDHEKTIRATQGRTMEEGKFENALFGAGADLKAELFQSLLKLA